MNTLAALRIYFPNSARLKKKGFWKNLLAPSLGAYLASEAKASGIEQVVMQTVRAGYLKGNPLSYDMSETPPPQLPQCIELVDEETRLRTFLNVHREQLEGTRAVILKAEDIIFDTAIPVSKVSH